MNFYKHHLGDYDGATAHLSWDEDMAYTRLLRAYYRREAPIPPAEVYRLARAITKAHKNAVDSVLREFFTQADDGFHNKRADEEITAYQAQAKTNRRIAQGRKGQRTVDESPNEPLHESSTKHTPNHKPEPEPEIRELRASRLSLETLPPEWEAFCREERPDVTPAGAFERFKDYWVAKPGKDGRKTDWFATWRNWVRNERSAVVQAQGASW